MAKLLRVLMALVSFVLLYHIMNGHNPTLFKPWGMTPEQLKEATTQQVKETIEELAPDVTIGEDILGKRFEIGNVQVVANGKLIPDVSTTVFITKLGDYSLGVDLRSIRPIPNEPNSFNTPHHLEVFVENNWLVFDKKGETLSYFSKVIALDNQGTKKQLLLELTCKRNEAKITGAKVIEVQKTKDGMFKFKNNKTYNYVKTIYKASSE